MHIYTDDKEQLLEYAAEFGDRKSAMELVSQNQRDFAVYRQTEKDKKTNKTKTNKEINKNNNNLDYER